MQIDMAFISIGVSLLVAIFSGLGRYAINSREREIDNQLSMLKGTVEELRHRLSDEEKETIRQNGAIELVKATHGDLKRDVEDIKSQMLTRAEFEPRMSSIEKSLSTLIAELREMRGAMPTR